MSRIVHLGPGAFFKAHLAAYTQDAGGWRITGLALRSARAAEQFQRPYTLLERDEHGTTARMIDVLENVIHVPSQPDAAMAALVDPETRIVSLTVTEKAYAPGALPELLMGALVARRAAGTDPFTCLSCDNLPGNGRVLKRLLMDAAPPDLKDWITSDIACPSTMVDGIVPARTPATEKEGGPWAEECETYRQWVIEDVFPTGRPAWAAEFVSDVTPHEEMKLRMLNGAHSMLAYSGLLAGYNTVRDVMRDPVLADRVRKYMSAAAATLNPIPGTDFEAYAGTLMARFRNPHLAHRTAQIAMDGSQKMPQRVFAPACEALAAGQDIGPFAHATAAWIAHLRDGKHVQDPRQSELDPATIAHVFALPNLLPYELARSDRWRAAVALALQDL